MALFTLDEWLTKFSIDEKIRISLKELEIKYIYGRNDPDLKYRSYERYITFNKKYEKWNEPNANLILYLIGDWMKKINFSDLLYDLEKKIPENCQNVVILNGKRNKLYSQFPENIIILHKYKDNQIIPKARLYKKNTIYDKLKILFDDVPNLTYQPFEILGYGSFFRNKERIGDVDLHFKHDHEHPRWNKFDTFFTERGERCFQFLDFIVDEYNKESRNTKGRIKSFRKKCLEKEFQKEVSRFGVDLEKDCGGCYVANRSHPYFEVLREIWGVSVCRIKYL